MWPLRSVGLLKSIGEYGSVLRAFPALTPSLLVDNHQPNHPTTMTSNQVRFKYVPKKTMSRNFPGHIDLYDKEGKRESLYTATERYKRLDWGVYVTTKTGRMVKKWKRTPLENWR